jgi:ABC-2 type transport system permease protein
MMGATSRYSKYLKLLTYLVAIVLINVVGITLFARIDLTASKAYSISDVSKKVVATLTEPLTIKVFFTRNLPAPHNNTEQYLRDLLEEYSWHAGRYFNYIFYDVNPQGSGPEGPAMGNRKLAGDYGIYPVQIQMVESDEIKFQNAYMGLVLIHGDVIERLPALTSTASLEYKLTTAIQKLNDKISALLALKEKVKIKLFLSSSLRAVAPYMGLNNLPTLSKQIEAVVEKLNKKNYDKLAFESIDPVSIEDQDAISKRYNIQALEWPAIEKTGVAAGQGVIGLVMEYGSKTMHLPLLNAINLPILGTRYSLTDAVQLEEDINKSLESLIEINQDLGLLASHGTLGSSPPGRQQADGINSFRTLVSENYSIKPVDLKKETIPSSLQSLVIARPTEKFSDYDLYQIDQALMRGTNLVIFMDTFKEEMPARQGFGLNRGPGYKPLDTGLEKLLAHYGVTLEKSYVLDENCYKQRVSQAMGGGERNIYFAPIIKSRYINRDLDFMKNIKGLVVVKASPVTLDEKRTGKAEISAHRLLASSELSWEMSDNINLNPMLLSPPGPAQNRESLPLAWLLEGKFPSYFTGKQIPVKTAEDKNKTDQEKPGEEQAPGNDLSMIQGKGEFIAKGSPARIFIMASAEMIKDNILDPNDSTPNGLFVLNVIDAMNNREDIAVMRAKVQQYNPLDDIQPSTRTAIKMLNIAGLPIAVTLFGFFVLLRRVAKKKRIQMMFPAQ